jgi:hypothetical protein
MKSARAEMHSFQASILHASLAASPPPIHPSNKPKKKKEKKQTNKQIPSSRTDSDGLSSR